MLKGTTLRTNWGWAYIDRAPRSNHSLWKWTSYELKNTKNQIQMSPPSAIFKQVQYPVSTRIIIEDLRGYATSLFTAKWRQPLLFRKDDASLDWMAGRTWSPIFSLMNASFAVGQMSTCQKEPERQFLLTSSRVTSAKTAVIKTPCLIACCLFLVMLALDSNSYLFILLTLWWGWL